MVGIEQYIKNLFLSNLDIVDALSIGKDDSLDPDIFIDQIPEFNAEQVEHQPLIVIKCKSAKDSLFYDGVFNAKDVTVIIGIGVNVYSELTTITALVNDLLHKNNFDLIDSDSFNDVQENVVGSRLTYRNSIFRALN